MHTNSLCNNPHKDKQSGFTLIELIVFMVIISVVLVGLGLAYREVMARSAEPIINQRLVSYAQSQLAMMLTKKFDENTGDDGTLCGLLLGCSAIGLDLGENQNNLQQLDDVDDFNGYVTTPETGVSLSVTVTHDGATFGLNNNYAKKIVVTVSRYGEQRSLTAYRFNQ